MEKYKPLIYFGAIVMMAILIFISIQNTNEDVNERYGNYILITDTTSINSKILYIDNFRGTGNWTMKDGRNYSFGSSLNYKYRPYELFEFCQNGDSVYKPKGSMNIYLIRFDSVYNFIIGEGLNRELR